MREAILTNWWALSLFGLFLGVFAGLFGLGGGAVIVPVLVLAFKFTQQEAQGTSLAVILSPAAAPAIWKYHSAGAIDWWFVLKVAPFMIVGSYFGAWIAVWLPQSFLRLLFALVLIYVAGYLVFSRLGNPLYAVLLAGVPAAVAMVLAMATGVFQDVIHPAPAAASRPEDSGSAETPEPAGGADLNEQARP